MRWIILARFELNSTTHPIGWFVMFVRTGFSRPLKSTRKFAGSSLLFLDLVMNLYEEQDIVRHGVFPVNT
jgi:hypothetical protein